jgi:hypothetical protein
MSECGWRLIKKEGVKWFGNYEQERIMRGPTEIKILMKM